MAEADGPGAGLVIVDELAASGDLGGYRYLHSTRGELLRRLDRTVEARAAFERALAFAHDEAERRFLTRRITELTP